MRWLGILTMLTGCATSTPGSDSYCLVYEPIFMSSEDSWETKDQIVRENSKYECLCNHDCPEGIE